MAQQSPQTDASPTPQQRRRARIAARLADPQVARDVQTLGGMVQIWCADHHAGADRVPYEGLGAQEGCYAPGRVPRLCPECAAHLEYGETRRALCPKDPKPSCHACDTHCYKPDERAWQRQVMAYAGPRAMFRGMFGDAVRHLRQELAGRRAVRAREKAREQSVGQPRRKANGPAHEQAHDGAHGSAGAQASGQQGGQASGQQDGQQRPGETR